MKAATWRVCVLISVPIMEFSFENGLLSSLGNLMICFFYGICEIAREGTWSSMPRKALLTIPVTCRTNEFGHSEQNRPSRRKPTLHIETIRLLPNNKTIVLFFLVFLLLKTMFTPCSHAQNNSQVAMPLSITKRGRRRVHRAASWRQFWVRKIRECLRWCGGGGGSGGIFSRSSR